MSEIIFDFTGNPFVDAGIWAISQWVGKKPDELDKEDLKNSADDLVDLYIEKSWSKALYSIFPNNPLINPSVKGEEKKKIAYMNLLEELINKTEYLGDHGNCIACGRRNIQLIDSNSGKGSSRFAKDKIPLSGSKSMINYFSFGVDGADYCPACALAVQFSPLVTYSCVLMLLMHSNSEKIMKYWSKRSINNVKAQILTKNFTGCFNEGYKNPKNAVFHIIQDIILKQDERWYLEKPSIIFYHFTNYIQGPSLDIYSIPTTVFRFLAFISQDEKFEDWLRIVRRGYKFVDWENVKVENEYKNRENTVYNNLLEDKSIIRFFIDRKNKEAIGGWDLMSHYLEEVRKMDEKRIGAIKKVGDELSDYIMELDDIKTLNRLEMAKDYRNFRNILRIVIKKRIANGIENPLFTFDDYVNYLFPEGNLTWRETQDLILFRIYEKLQPWIIQQGNQSELETFESEEAKEEE